MALEKCPVCEAPLERKEYTAVKKVRVPRRPDEIPDPRYFNRRAMPKGGKFEDTVLKLVEVPVPVLCCEAGCGWEIVRGDEGSLLGASPDLPEACGLGHRFSWGGYRLGHRWDLLCWGVVERASGHYKCSEGQSVVLRLQGFLNGHQGGSLANETKAAVLVALTHFVEPGASVSEVMGVAGLTRGQVSGALSRGVDTGLVVRSEKMERIIPMGKGFLYRLSPRGGKWVQWGIDTGLISPVGDGE